MLRVLSLLALCLSLCSGFALTAAPGVGLQPQITMVRGSEITMGRGDKRTAKGKRKAKSFGNSRPRNSAIRKRKAASASASEE